jgi:hypothetical protein
LHHDLSNGYIENQASGYVKTEMRTLRKVCDERPRFERRYYISSRESADALVGNNHQARCARPGDAAASGAGLVRGAANAGQSKLNIEDLDLAS